MDDAHVVEVLDSVQDLADELAGISLCVETLLHDPVKQLSSRYSARLQRMQHQCITLTVVANNCSQGRTNVPPVGLDY